MNLPADFKELSKSVIKIGNESLEMLQQFLSKHVSKESLVDGLPRLQVEEIMSENWDKLTSDARYVPRWQVLQTLQGLIAELEYQVGEYGESTPYDDFKDIAINLKRIAENVAVAEEI